MLGRVARPDSRAPEASPIGGSEGIVVPWPDRPEGRRLERGDGGIADLDCRAAGRAASLL